MKPARLIVLVIALAAGGVAAMMASGLRQPPAPAVPPPAPPMATVDVLVAKADLNIGQTVSEKDVGWQMWPAASAGNFIKKADRPDAMKEFVGAIVRSPVVAGEPIRDNKVVTGKNLGYMAVVLPKGMRAVAMDVAADTSAGGFVLPNDHEGRISLRVMTEVSDITSQNSLTIPIPGTTNTVTVPAIRTRRADTTVEIPSGGSLAMAGMIRTRPGTTSTACPV